MADKRGKDALVQQTLLDGDDDLAAELDVLTLGRAVHRAVADGKAVDLCLFDEVDGVQRIRVGGRRAEDVILDARQHAKLALDGDAALVGVLDDLAGKLNVVLIRKGRAVDHDRGVAARNGGLDAVHVLAVVKVEHDGDWAVGAVFLDGIADVQRTLLLVGDSAVGEIGAAAHEGVGEVCALQNGGAAEHFVYGDDGLCLRDGVHIERALSITVGLGGFQKGTKRRKHGGSSFLLAVEGRFVGNDHF